MSNTHSSFSSGKGLACGCGCGTCQGASGLGSGSDEENSEAKKTTEDLLQTAKDYINDEIPNRYKLGAAALLVGVVWWRSRCR